MNKDDETWLKICQAAMGALVAFLVYRGFVYFGGEIGWLERYHAWYPIASTIVGVVGGGLAAYWLVAEAERREYFLATIGEVRRVAWPSIPDTKRMTVIVAIVVAIFAVILAVFDVGWVKALHWLLTF